MGGFKWLDRKKAVIAAQCLVRAKGYAVENACDEVLGVYGGEERYTLHAEDMTNRQFKKMKKDVAGI